MALELINMLRELGYLSRNWLAIYSTIEVENIKNLLYIKKGRKLFQSVFRIHQYITGARKSKQNFTTIWLYNLSEVLLSSNKFSNDANSLK